MLLLLWSAWRRDSAAHQRSVGLGGIFLCVVTIGAIVWYMVSKVTAGAGVIAVDNFRWIADIVFLVATIGTLMLGVDYNAREKIFPGESHALLIFATSGMMILAAARDLMIVFLGIEIMSIAVYSLAALNRRSERSAEGALKYFLLGAFSTGFLLYGIALVYGATASTNLTVIGERIVSNHIMSNPMLIVGVAMLLIGFGFKVALAPFHMWAPDVYDGAPTPVTAYMAAAVKAAAFTAFIRVWLEAFPNLTVTWHRPIWWLAALTMIVGNAVALSQKNIKRMLAYSSIAHAGYILVTLVSGYAGTSAFLFYIVAYTLATFGAFAVVVTLSGEGDRYLNIEDYAGLWNVRPGLASAMAVFMLALLGFPIFGGIGFFAKWYVIKAALQGPVPQVRLAVILVITSVVSAGYYLYVVMVMFMKPRPEGAIEPEKEGSMTKMVIMAAAIAILVLGVFPNTVGDWAQGAEMKPLPRSGPALPGSPPLGPQTAYNVTP